MLTVVLKRKRQNRVEQGHPWIFQSEIERTEGEGEPGQLVRIVTYQGAFLATGYWNPKSQITVRVVAYTELASMDVDFLTTRLQEARQHRLRFLGEAESYRAVYGEADFLPGLIVDKFADVLVVQILTLGMELCREQIVKAVTIVFQPKCIYERSDVSVRELEGLEQRTGILYGELDNPVAIVENGLLIDVDVVNGQKTGYFFDQRDNRAALEPLMRGWGQRSGIQLQSVIADGEEETLVPVNSNGKIVTYPYWDGATVLECFAHTGSFTLHACQYGAKQVTCLDVSELAIENAKRNVERNGFSERVEYVVDDAFEYLRRQVKGLEERTIRARANSAAEKVAGKMPKIGKVDTSKPLSSDGRKWDVVILDPPAFAKNKQSIDNACRGYKDINLHALKLVNEGGYLVTASCSFHVRPDVFLETILSAAVDAGKVLRLIEFSGAGKDHPRLLGVEEGHYLKFAIFEVRSRDIK
jgi:23S rRNA (cytosine1962-C5)-methyltransferase